MAKESNKARLLKEFQKAANRANSIAELMKSAKEKIIKIGTDIAKVFMLKRTEKRNVLELIDENDSVYMKFSTKKCLLLNTLEKDEISRLYFSENLSKEEQELFTKNDLQSYYLIPISGSKENQGLLLVGNTDSDLDLSEEEQLTILNIATIIGWVLDSRELPSIMNGEEKEKTYIVSPSLQAVLQDKSWYKTIVDTMAEGIIASDLTHTIVFVNPELCQMVGYTKEELLGQPVFKIIIEEDREKVIRYTERRVKEKISTQYEVALKTKVGSRIPALISGTPILGSSDQILGTYAIVTDIRDRRIVEKEISDKNAELQGLYINLLGLYEQLGSIIAETTKIHAEILLFTSKQCVYCAPAEKVLQEVLAAYAGKITYRKVDIDEEPELAEEYEVMSLPTIAIGDEILTSVPDAYRLHSALFSALVPEEKFRKTRQELDNLIDNSPIAIMTINKEGIITGINPLVEALIGQMRNEIVGKNLFTEEIGKPTPMSETMLSLFRTGFKGEKITIDRFPIKELNPEAPLPFTIISFKVVPLTSKEGEVTEILVLAEDVTEKALQEEELEDSYKKLEELNEKLVQMNKERANFVEITSSELVVPLRASRELTDQVLSGRLGKLSEETLGIMEYLRSNLEKIAKRITSILDFSKIEIQGFILKFEKQNLKELVSEALKEIGSVVIDKGFIVFLEVPEDFVVWCDKDQIIKVINNIILNAIKFTPKDCTIQISVEEWMNETLKISITDNGIGLKKGNLTRIFEQYTKVDPNSDGSGLGLTVVKSIVDAHGGEVWAESEGLNKGSTFSFTLPKTKAALKSIQTQQEAELSQLTE